MTPSPGSKQFVLLTNVKSILSGTLGALPQRLFPQKLTDVIGAVRGGVTFAVLFCAIPWLIFGTSYKLSALALWGAVYLAFAARTASLTSASVLRIIQYNILPELSESAAKEIDSDLERRFQPDWLDIVASYAALAATLASAFAIENELKHISSLGVIWCCGGFFFLYFISARTTYTACFYGSFAAHLNLMKDRIYPLDPARSIMVSHFAFLGRRILFFWTGIGASILTLYPIFYKSLPTFVLLVVPTASFFSAIFGTYIFLKSEIEIARAANGVLSSSLRSTEQQIARLPSKGDLTEAKEI